MSTEVELVPVQVPTQVVQTEPTEAAVKEATRLEQKIVLGAQALSRSSWELAKALHEFHEKGYWALLGYDTLEEFLARPELGLSRSSFFRMTKAWRDLVVVRQVDEAALRKIEPSKVQEVLPAIMRGDVTVEEGLADAEELGKRDLRVKYHPERASESDKAVAAGGAVPDDQELDNPSARRVKCEACGSWYSALDDDDPPEDGDNDDGDDHIFAHEDGSDR